MKALLAVLLLSLSGNAIAEWVEYHTRANGDVFFSLFVDGFNKQLCKAAPMSAIKGLFEHGVPIRLMSI